MINLLGRDNSNFCDGMSRREALQLGTLGSMSLGLPQLLSSQAAAESEPKKIAASSTFGQAKRVILFFMWGGPAHQDTWDLKPDGPTATKGEFLPIETNVPGVHISEHFPHLSKHADKLAILRSVGQEDNNHSTGAHAGLTGRRHELKAENFKAGEKDFPHYGSVLSKLRANHGSMPTFVALPDIIATTAGAVTPGQGGGFLGKTYDPFQIIDHPDRKDFSVSSLKLPSELTNLRMQSRRSLLSQIENVARLNERADNVQSMDAFYQQALDMVLSPKARQAFDLTKVSEEERWRYGWHTFGQSTLLAKRLIESGVKLVTVYWHREVPTIDSSWDTHGFNFQELKNRLMPSADRPIAALLEDLEQQGLLDETLIIWNSEFGRTPRINSRAGRDHWGPCNSVVFAGGGMPGGQVYGASDEQAAYPIANKVTQDDIAATVYHLLGMEPDTLIHDRVNRPFPVALGEPIMELLGDKCSPEPVPSPVVRINPPEIGPFGRMLRERCRRFLDLDFGNPDSEQNWELTGWNDAVGEGLERHRKLGEKPVVLKDTGQFYGHFNFGFAVFRLASPKGLKRIQLSLNRKLLPVPEELANGEERKLWQIPFPAGVIQSASRFELSITAPDWQVTDFALVGDEILDLHLERYRV